MSSQPQPRSRREFLAWFVAGWVLAASRARGDVPPAVAAPGGFVPELLAGERLTYRLRWGVFQVGTAELAVGAAPVAPVGGGPPGWPVTFTVRSSGVAERLYRVRTAITSWLPADGRRSVGYRKQQDEGGRRKDEVVAFDDGAGVARYTNFGEPGPDVPVPPGTHDPLSILFAFRRPDVAPPAPGEEASLPVTDGRKLVDVSVRADAPARVKVPAGTFRAWCLRPDTRDLGGVFRKSRDASLELWLADDARRTPVLLRSSVAVGSFAGELVSRALTAPASARP